MPIAAAVAVLFRHDFRHGKFSHIMYSFKLEIYKLEVKKNMHRLEKRKTMRPCTYMYIYMYT